MTKWRHMVSEILVHTGLGNGVLPGGRRQAINWINVV